MKGRARLAWRMPAWVSGLLKTLYLLKKPAALTTFNDKPLYVLTDNAKGRVLKIAPKGGK